MSSNPIKDYDTLIKELNRVPGVLEFGKWFDKRVDDREKRFLEMGMNKLDAAHLSFLITFHEAEDGLGPHSF